MKVERRRVKFRSVTKKWILTEDDEVGLEEHAETRKIRSRSVCLYHKGKDCGFGGTARP